MKLGIISDIHGDYKALVEALYRLDNIHKVDQILCAGDLVGRGPEQNRVVELVRQRNIQTVRGNHDEWLYNLSDDNTQYLRNLPLSWSRQINGMRVYMCHGKPGNNLWGMYRDHISETYLNMVLSSLKADILITGHTHLPLYMRVTNGCMVNPGSLFTFESSRGTSHTYGVLDVGKMLFEVFDITSPTVEPIAQEEYI